MPSGSRESRLTWTVTDRADEPDEVHARGNADAHGKAFITREWAWGGATGAGVNVCIVDSGIEADHPLVGPVRSAHVVKQTDSGVVVQETGSADVFGHGTACASIVRTIAPECEIHSLRVLGGRGGGSGDVLVGGLRWAIAQGFDVINLSLSTPRQPIGDVLRALSDDAYFQSTAIVASAHNSKIESFPWRFASVISVGSHTDDDPMLIRYNPVPPVEFFARGQSVPVAGLSGTLTTNTGNSFAAPHVAGLVALMLSKHPGLKPFQIKTILYLVASNVRSVE